MACGDSGVPDQHPNQTPFVIEEGRVDLLPFSDKRLAIHHFDLATFEETRVHAADEEDSVIIIMIIVRIFSLR